MANHVVTHGMPCVNMNCSLPCLYKGLTWAIAREGRAQDQSVGAARRKGRERRRRRRKGKEKGREGKEEGGGKERRKKRRKEKKKGEEERKKKEEEEEVLRSEQPRTEKNSELRYRR